MSGEEEWLERARARERDVGWSDRDASREARAEVLDAERALARSRGEAYAVEIDLVFRWNSGAPLPHVVANERRAFIVVIAAEPDPNWDGVPRSISADDGVQRLFGVIELDHVHELRFGGPSDEGLSEHRLYGRGLRLYAAHEVFGDFSPGRQFLFVFHDSIVEACATGIESRTARCTFAEVLSDTASDVIS